MNVSDLVDTVRNIPNCVVFPPIGLPVIAQNHQLPKDLELFYKMCGGMNLFIDMAFPTRISAPGEFVLANPVIFSQVSQEELEATKGDASWSWYIIGYGPNFQYITVDLAESRLGRYYNSFWINHPGNSEVIALSLNELLEHLLATQGEYYWFDA